VGWVGLMVEHKVDMWLFFGVGRGTMAEQQPARASHNCMLAQQHVDHRATACPALPLRSTITCPRPAHLLLAELLLRSVHDVRVLVRCDWPLGCLLRADQQARPRGKGKAARRTGGVKRRCGRRGDLDGIGAECWQADSGHSTHPPRQSYIFSGIVRL